jgi:hypothetical protein
VISIAQETEDMHQLNIAVPPMWEAALGYTEEARYIGVYWESVGDVAVVTDGRTTRNAWWDAFLGYVTHPAIAPSLAPYQLGLRTASARHYLLLDRHHRVLYVAAATEAAAFLRAQWSPPPAGPVQLHAPMGEQGTERSLTHQQSMAELADWLDQHADQAGA